MLELTDFEEELIPSPLLRWKEELNNRPHAADPLEFEMTTVTQIPSDENNESPPRYSNNRRYPTTREELNAIRRHNAQVVIFCVLIAAVFSFVLYVFSPRYFLFLLIIGTVLYSFKIAQSRRRVRQRADSTSRDS